MRNSFCSLRTFRPAIAGAAATLATAALLVSSADEASSLDVVGPACPVPEAGKLKASAVPQGISATDCKLTGRVITGPGGVGVTIPEPGEVAGVSALLADDGGPSTKPTPAGLEPTFQVAVTPDGTLKYPKARTPAAAQRSSGAQAAADPGECSDTDYSYNGVRASSTYKWYIGDGPQAAGMSQWDAARMSSESLKSVTQNRNNCRIADYMPVASKYQGTTVREANINRNSQCTKRDKQSIWDAGNLAAGNLAVTCWWGVTGKGRPARLVEADVRYNIDDFDFTNNPSRNCTRKFDYRGVGAHEAGHVFGLGHVGEGHSNLTMYTSMKPCTAKARSLGRGDIRGLRYLYN